MGLPIKSSFFVPNKIVSQTAGDRECSGNLCEELSQCTDDSFSIVKKEVAIKKCLPFLEFTSQSSFFISNKQQNMGIFSRKSNNFHVASFFIFSMSLIVSLRFKCNRIDLHFMQLFFLFSLSKLKKCFLFLGEIIGLLC